MTVGPVRAGTSCAFGVSLQSQTCRLSAVVTASLGFAIDSCQTRFAKSTRMGSWGGTS